MEYPNWDGEARVSLTAPTLSPESFISLNYGRSRESQEGWVRGLGVRGFVFLYIFCFLGV